MVSPAGNVPAMPPAWLPAAEAVIAVFSSTVGFVIAPELAPATPPAFKVPVMGLST